MQGSVWALDADDSCLGVRGIVAGQGLMVRVGGLLVRVALCRRVGASVAGDRLLAAWPTGGEAGVSGDAQIRVTAATSNSWLASCLFCHSNTTTTT